MSRSSHSEVETYLLCQRRHMYSYGMRLQSKTTSNPLFMGNVGHAGLAAFYSALKDGKTYDEAVELAEDEILNEAGEYEVYDKRVALSNVWHLMQAYFEHYKAHDQDWEILEVEKKVLIPIGDDNVMVIVVDLIVRERGVGIVAIDHKFTYDFYNPESVDLNPQLVKYMAALRSAGYSVARVMYNEIRTRDTKENKDDISKRFKRTPFKPTAARITRTMKEHVVAAKRIVRMRELGPELWDEAALRVANKMVCQSCPFSAICTNDLNEYGHEALVANEYKIRESIPLSVIPMGSGDFNASGTDNGAMATTA